MYDRVAAAYPLAVAYVGLLILYGWQVSRHSTPWNFIDELQWAELSQGVAHSGRPELRHQAAGFHSLYAYFLAPAWWLGATGKAYAAAKYLNVAAMTASLFPAYGLARLFVRRVPALFVATATAATPAIAYSGMLIPEPLAYLWSTLALWLLARALLRPGRATIAAALLAVAIAPAVRSELALLAPTAIAAGAIVFAGSSRGRRLIGGWSRRELAGAVVLIVLVLVWTGSLVTHHSYSWQVGTGLHGRMFTYGLWAIGAYAIGIGILPVLIALIWMLGMRFRSPEETTLFGLLVGTAACFIAYTAVKAAYISTTFAIRVEERDLIYLSPVVFCVTARWLSRPTTRALPWALAGAAVGYLIETTPYHAYEHLYSDAFGLSILQWLNQEWYFTNTDLRRLLFAVLAAGIVATAGVELLRRRTSGPALRTAGLVTAAAVGALVVGWNLAGEIQAANASNSMADSFRSVLPTPPDWIDRATGRARTMFIGKALEGSQAFWSLEFWNQSLGDIWSVDATAPGPGPTVTPDFTSTDGTVRPQLPVDWAVAGPGVDLVGRIVEEAGGLRLYRLEHPVRIADAESGVTPDGWMSTSAQYNRFAGPNSRRGVAVVTLSRAAACGKIPASRITIRLSKLVLTAQAQPAAGRLLAIRRVTIHSTPCDTRTVRIPVRPPFRIEASADRTFQPSQYDPRQLSVTISFGFEPGATS